ncbi:MAG: hypothetical protein ABGZ53_34870, partial [Fuerstiella sp.]
GIRVGLKARQRIRQVFNIVARCTGVGSRNSAEPCFPGAVTGETEINCPHCGELLTVTVNEPFGEESYQCSECSSAFDVAWGEGQIKYSVE